MPGKDNRARHGYSPNWQKQRRKQDEASRNANATSVACPNGCGSDSVHVIGHEEYSCFECDTRFTDDDIR